MATRQETAAFVLQQRGLPERFSVKGMFGEYALYADGRTVGLICDDQLYVKVHPATAALADSCELAPAYPGSKDHYVVPEEMITGHRSLPALLLRLASELPPPKLRRKTTKR